MKFLHLGDLHLGRSLNEYDLIDDQRYILNQILTIVDSDRIDAVLISGDVYDKATPAEAAVNLLDDFLCRLAARKVKVFLISGNHDSDDRLNFGSRLFSDNGIYISSVFDGTLHRQTMEDEFGEVDIYLLPFVKASHVKHFFPDAEIENYEDAVRTVIESAHVDPTRRSVILAHQFVTGEGADPTVSGSESAGTKSVGTVERISYECFAPFSYVALGHIHGPQAVGRDTVRYAGSPLKYSISEENGEKSVPIITMNEPGSVKIELVPLKPLRDLRCIRGTMQELLSRENIHDRDDYLHVILTDEDPIDDAIGIFQQTYPRTLRIDYDNAHTRAELNTDIFTASEVKPFPDLIREFYHSIYGLDMSDEELGVMLETAKEAKIYEAN